MSDEQTTQQIKKIREMMRAVCGSCNHNVPMACYNKHTNGMDCESIRYREVLTVVFGQSWTE